MQPRIPGLRPVGIQEKPPAADGGGPTLVYRRTGGVAQDKHRLGNRGGVRIEKPRWLAGDSGPSRGGQLVACRLGRTGPVRALRVAPHPPQRHGVSAALEQLPPLAQQRAMIVTIKTVGCRCRGPLYDQQHGQAVRNQADPLEVGSPAKLRNKACQLSPVGASGAPGAALENGKLDLQIQGGGHRKAAEKARTRAVGA